MKKKHFFHLFMFSIITNLALGGCGESKASGMEDPDGLGYHTMAYDSESDKIIIFGGQPSDYSMKKLNTTWVFDRPSETWEKRQPAVKPPPSSGHAMVYDSESDRIVMFNGRTWTYDCNNNVWEEKHPDLSPGMLNGPAMAYDSESDKIIMYGGYLSTATWIYDLNTDSWKKIQGGLSPENRMFPAMTYDKTVDRVILFGGGTGAQSPHFGTVYSDTWSFDCNTGVWEKLEPVHSPGKRVYGTMVFCKKLGVPVLFGGWAYDVNNPADGKLWGFDFHRQDWFLLDREESLTPLRKHAMVYDPMRDEAVIFGGISGVPQPASEPPFLKDLHLIKF